MKLLIVIDGLMMICSSQTFHTIPVEGKRDQRSGLLTSRCTLTGTNLPLNTNHYSSHICQSPELTGFLPSLPFLWSPFLPFRFLSYFLILLLCRSSLFSAFTRTETTLPKNQMSRRTFLLSDEATSLRT